MRSGLSHKQECGHGSEPQQRELFKNIKGTFVEVEEPKNRFFSATAPKITWCKEDRRTTTLVVNSIFEQ